VVTKRIADAHVDGGAEETLLEIVNEEFGLHVEFDDFADAVLGLSEDVPGFETISAKRFTRYRCLQQATIGPGRRAFRRGSISFESRRSFRSEGLLSIICPRGSTEPTGEDFALRRQFVALRIRAARGPRLMGRQQLPKL
jgi:hypothetical protein